MTFTNIFIKVIHVTVDEIIDKFRKEEIKKRREREKYIEEENISFTSFLLFLTFFQ
jgi:hypothetical protein